MTYKMCIIEAKTLTSSQENMTKSARRDANTARSL